MATELDALELIGGISVTTESSGKSKKDAEQNAAIECLKNIN